MMGPMRRAPTSACAAAAVVACLVCPAPAAPGAEGDVVFDAVLESAQVRLGEDVVIRLSLVNRSAKAVEVPEFRLARDSVSVAVAWPVDGKLDTRATVTRVWGRWGEDASGLRMRPAPTAVRSVAAGATMTGSVSFPVVATGDLALTASYGADGANGAPRRTSKPLLVEVVPKSPQTPKRLLATVETSKGTFVAELDGTAAFNSVSHFWKLARDEFYTGLTFHRVEPGLLVQGGCPRGDGTGGAGFRLPAEGPAGRSLARGVFGLARTAHADSASSQFFAVSDPRGLAGKALTTEFTPLGRIVEGQEVVDELAKVDTDPTTQRPRVPPSIVAVRVAVK